MKVSHSSIFFSRYIFHELLPKEALSASFLPVYIEQWVDDSMSDYFYTEDHEVWPDTHLKQAGWYLDCSKGYIPPSEKALHATLNAEAPLQIVVYEPSVQEETEKETSKATKGKKESKGKKEPKGKKGKTVDTPSGTPASQTTISTRSATKAAVEASAAPIIVGSPSIPLVSVVPAPSYSAATAPAFTRKRKALAAATSATSSEATSTYTLIENVYMGDLMEHFNKTKTHHEAFLRIEEFLVKVRVISFHIVPIFFSYKHSSSLFDNSFFFSRLEAAALAPTQGSPSPTLASTSSLQMFQRTSLCPPSLAPPLISPCGTAVVSSTWMISSHLLKIISTTTVSL